MRCYGTSDMMTRGLLNYKFWSNLSSVIVLTSLRKQKLQPLWRKRHCLSQTICPLPHLLCFFYFSSSTWDAVSKCSKFILGFETKKNFYSSTDICHLKIALCASSCSIFCWTPCAVLLFSVLVPWVSSDCHFSPINGHLTWSCGSGGVEVYSLTPFLFLSWT